MPVALAIAGKVNVASRGSGARRRTGEPVQSGRGRPEKPCVAWPGSLTPLLMQTASHGLAGTKVVKDQWAMSAT